MYAIIQQNINAANVWLREKNMHIKNSPCSKAPRINKFNIKFSFV